MNLRLTITIIISKLIMKACRMLKMGGTTLPGKIAQKIHPEAIRIISKGFKIIMVTGTNGKTTTSRIIGQILCENGLDYISNKSGANLSSGIITTFLEAVDIKGRCRISNALIEVDEAAFVNITKYFKPDVLVVTNFFRDQLDRYGELYTTLSRVRAGIEKSERTRLVLNADDSLCASLGNGVTNEVIFYGMDKNATNGIEETVNSDAMFCIYCKTKYEYDNHVYGHLGGFKCPGCGYGRPGSDVTCTVVDELTSSHSKIHFTINPITETEAEMEAETDETYTARINLPGLYNVYNSLAALSCGKSLGLPLENSIRALGNFECGFGRMETILTDDRVIKLILVKNPTGFNQVLNYLLTEETEMQVAFLINDKLADGTDISWLWDVDFEKLQGIQGRFNNVFTSGIRAEDMSVRLKYAGIYADKIRMIKDYKELISTGLSETAVGQSFYILPTYTAMLDIRKILKEKFRLKDFWK